MVLPSTKFKKIIFYLLSVEAINTQFTVILVAYTSVTSHVGGMAVTQTLIDLRDNETDFIENKTEVDVESVSNAVMWSCRTEAQANGFYKGIYLISSILVIILAIFAFVTTFFRPEFWCKRKVLIYKAVIGDTFLAVAIIMLFLSFDLSPLSCQAGYTALDYQILHKLLDLLYNVNVVNFHIAAPFISLGCFSAWIATSIICLVIEYKKREEIQDIFKDKMYDSDALTEDENEERHYEINRVSHS